MGKSSELGKSICSSETRFFWRENVEYIKMAERKQNMAHHMEEIDETRGSWRTNIIS